MKITKDSGFHIQKKIKGKIVEVDAHGNEAGKTVRYFHYQNSCRNYCFSNYIILADIFSSVCRQNETRAKLRQEYKICLSQLFFLFAMKLQNQQLAKRNMKSLCLSF